MKVTVTLDKKDVVDKIQTASRKLPGANRYILNLICLDIISISIKEFLSGPRSGTRLGRKTGNLAQSLDHSVIGNWDAEVYANAPYAAVHEFGASVPAVSGKLMHFITEGGDEVFTMKHKAFEIPARPFLAPAINKEFDEGRALRIAEKVLAQQLDGEAIHGL